MKVSRSGGGLKPDGLKSGGLRFKGFTLFLLMALMILNCCSAESSNGVDMMTLPPMKDQFAAHFMIGNIVNPADVSSSGVTNRKLTQHYNVLTAENDMKPQYLSPSRGNYSYGTADRMVNAAIASGFKVVGHTLLWHSQIPTWQQSIAGRETALAAMKQFITDVVTHFKGRIYSWDVLNEVFPDGTSGNWRTSMRSDNPWYRAIGADFVYEGFKAARLADPGAILYYNDYNMDNSGKATMVRNMVRDVNGAWENDSQYDGRLLIEGIGMQSHHNTGVSVGSVRNSINLFRPLGVKISISELDILSQSWNEYSTNTRLNDNGKERAATLYGECFKLFVENSDIIERVTFWGVYDEQSWRARAKPLPFEGRSTSSAKPAYYKIIESLE
jgi:endo-1,4-beta-xylanase